MPNNQKRLEQLREAALNLGMSDDHAQFYAATVLEQEAAERHREANAIHDAEHGFYADALGYPINPNL